MSNQGTTFLTFTSAIFALYTARRPIKYKQEFLFVSIIKDNLKMMPLRLIQRLFGRIVNWNQWMKSVVTVKSMKFSTEFCIKRKKL